MRVTFERVLTHPQVFQWVIVLPLELTVCSFTVGYWNKDVNVAVWITLFWLFIIFVNIFGTLGYAEEEFWAACFKLAMTVIFMIIAIILICGGGPSDGIYDEYWGARLWYDPGAFQNGFRGFCSVFVTAAFAFSGTELVGVCTRRLILEIHMTLTKVAVGRGRV